MIQFLSEFSNFFFENFGYLYPILQSSQYNLSSQNLKKSFQTNSISKSNLFYLKIKTHLSQETRLLNNMQSFSVVHDQTDNTNNCNEYTNTKSATLAKYTNHGASNA